MEVDAVVFDVYGTLIDIETDEGDIKSYEEISQFLSKYDFTIGAKDLRDAYFNIQNDWVGEKKQTYGIKYPEVRVVDVWEEILINYADCPKRCPTETLKGLSETLPLLFRSLTLRRMNILPYVIPTLEELNQRGYKLSIISNAQALITIPELNEFKLMKYFYPLILSSTYGVKKPEKQLFMEYLRVLKLKPEQIVFVGNDMRDDIYGASQLGIKTIFVDTPIGVDVFEDVQPDVNVKRMDDILEYIK